MEEKVDELYNPNPGRNMTKDVGISENQSIAERKSYL